MYRIKIPYCQIPLKRISLLLVYCLLETGMTAQTTTYHKAESFLFSFKENSDMFLADYGDNAYQLERMGRLLDASRNRLLKGNSHLLIVSHVDAYGGEEESVINEASLRANRIRAYLKVRFDIPHECVAFYIDRSGSYRDRVHVYEVYKPLPWFANTSIHYSESRYPVAIKAAVDRYGAVPYADLYRRGEAGGYDREVYRIDDPLFDRSELEDIARQIEQVIHHLVDTFSVGNALKNGVPVAIVGETNAGKSTLLNALLNEERAIVSDIHGTTRDVIEDTMNLGGITFRFIDTAGIRETTDTIESLGIERSFQKLDQADIVLWVIDATYAEEQYRQLADKILPRCKNKHLVIVFNKADLLSSADSSADEQLARLKATLPDLPEDACVLSLSAKQKEGLSQLQKQLVDFAALPDLSQNDVVVSNIRHYEALSRALEAIHRVQDGLTMQLSGDLVSQDLRECLYHLGEIVGGTIETDEVLGNIFKHFCVGK